MNFQPRLPIDGVLARVGDVLNDHASAVVLAAPGAGKTTRIPLFLKDADWLAGKRIVMLEPRRLAARMAATHMARTLNEDVGQTVGFRVRFESKVSAATRIEVVTEGILSRRLQRDPELSDIGLLIFDEFHERSLDADLGLALALDVQRSLRPDLKILVMSATLDDQAVSKVLDGAPTIACAHRPHPVETHYAAPGTDKDLARSMAALIHRALIEEDGSILAFLPGEGEIRRAAAALEEAALPANVVIAPLFGALLAHQQQQAVAPAKDGTRKIVLATTIAETSLTIEGVRIVVDSGYKRVPRFHPGRGMTRLETVRVSQAAAEQRRGRAGRLGPGVCYRMWLEAETRGLVPFDSPEILEADLAPLALDLAAWGVGDPEALSWLSPPPPGALSQAKTLLQRLDALDQRGHITDEGRAMADLPLHPRLAHMVHRGVDLGHGGLACDIAALLSERDILSGERNPDIRLRLEALSGASRQNINKGALTRVKAASAQIRRRVGCSDGTSAVGAAGELLALAYPDRIGQRRGAGRFRLSGGGGASLDEADPLAASDFLVVAELGGGAGDARIFLAALITLTEVENEFSADIVQQDEVVWDKKTEAVAAFSRRKLGALILAERPTRNLDPTLVLSAMIDGIRAMGLGALPWSPALRALQARAALLRKTFPEEGWPDMSDDALLNTLPDWLGPFLAGITRRVHLDRLDLNAALRSLLTWPLASKLDELAPAHISVPSGSNIAVDYEVDGGPALHVKLQEVFGLAKTPRIADGRVPVTVHLLSPARRPLAVTQDLESFWNNAYADVRREMRGRYPKHVWPENPLEATAMRRTTKPRGS